MSKWLALFAGSLLCCWSLLAGSVASAADADPTVTLVKRGEAFIVDVKLAFPVPLRTAWEVLTDYDHLAEIVSNLDSSRIVSRQGNTWIVRQEGVAKFGPFSYVFASEREIKLEPMKRILARQISGSAKRFASDMQLAENGSETSGHYHAEIVPESGFARTFGGPFVAHEIEEQFAAMSAEMLRRRAP